MFECIKFKVRAFLTSNNCSMDTRRFCILDMLEAQELVLGFTLAVQMPNIYDLLLQGRRVCCPIYHNCQESTCIEFSNHRISDELTDINEESADVKCQFLNFILQIYLVCHCELSWKHYNILYDIFCISYQGWHAKRAYRCF